MKSRVMKIKAFTVIDTNVLVAGIISESGYSTDILSLIFSGNVIPIFDKRMFEEYYQVLNYKKLKIDDETIKKILFIFCEMGICVSDMEKTKVLLSNKDDIPFFEVKESSDEFDSMLVTGNLKHYPIDDNIVTPKELITALRAIDKYVRDDIDYDKSINDIISANMLMSKYSSAEQLYNEIIN